MNIDISYCMKRLIPGIVLVSTLDMPSPVMLHPTDARLLTRFKPPWTEPHLILPRPRRFPVLMKLMGTESAPSDERCVVCHDVLSEHDPAVLVQLVNCGHVFGFNCVVNWFRSEPKPSKSACPICRVSAVRQPTLWESLTTLPINLINLIGLKIEHKMTTTLTPKPNNNHIKGYLLEREQDCELLTNHRIDSIRKSIISNAAVTWQPIPGNQEIIVVRTEAITKNLCQILQHYKVPDFRQTNGIMLTKYIIHMMPAFLAVLEGHAVKADTLFEWLHPMMAVELVTSADTETRDKDTFIAALRWSWEQYFATEYPALDDADKAIAPTMTPVRVENPLHQFQEYWKEILAVLIQLRIENERANRRKVIQRDLSRHFWRLWRIAMVVVLAVTLLPVVATVVNPGTWCWTLFGWLVGLVVLISFGLQQAHDTMEGLMLGDPRAHLPGE